MQCLILHVYALSFRIFKLEYLLSNDVYPFTPSVQFPPFWNGLLAHSFSSIKWSSIIHALYLCFGVNVNMPITGCYV